MSRPSHLPPRAPFQRKIASCPTLEPSSFKPPRINDSGTRHHKSLSHSSSLDDQPAWLDDLLSDSESIPKRTFHCRSASDSVTLLHDFVPNMVFSTSNDEEYFASEDGGNKSESPWIYGSTSDCRKSNMESISESSALLALSDYISHSPLQCVEELYQSSRTTDFDPKVDCCASSNELNNEPNTRKRHPGQRSRARKLQYIAELERTANVFEALQSELAVRISRLLEQRAVLSMENGKLKQQMARLQQQKLMMDGEYQTLRKEAERLKLGLASSLSDSHRTYAAGSSETGTSEISWQKLDWTKLHL